MFLLVAAPKTDPQTSKSATKADSEQSSSVPGYGDAGEWEWEGKDKV